MGVSLPVLGVPGLFGGGLSLDQYLASLGTWTLNLKFNEASGAIVNHGSDGGTGTVTGCTQAQAGQLGAQEAYLFDGVDDVVTFANAAVPATKALTTQRGVMLVNPSSLGESSSGYFWGWNLDGVTLSHRMAFATNNRIAIVLDALTTDAYSLTSNDQYATFNVWRLVFWDYDDADVLGLGRTIRLFVADASTPTTLLSLGTNTAAVGAIVPPAHPLQIGNGPLSDHTFAGLMDFALEGAGLWSPNSDPTNLTIPNRIRSLVFGI